MILRAMTTAPTLWMIAVLPLSFEPNLGQSDPRVQFLTQGPGYRLFLTSTEAVLKLRRGAEASVVRLRLEGANPASAGTGLDLLPERRHYFIGRDSSRWRTN